MVETTSPNPAIGSTLMALFVADQTASASYYGHVLGVTPTLNVPGMTKFPLPGGAELGLMPETQIAAILPNLAPTAASGTGIARCEVYLYVADPASAHLRALEAGGRELSPLSPRAWGDEAAYSQCPDGHLLIFARLLTNPSNKQ